MQDVIEVDQVWVHTVALLSPDSPAGCLVHGIARGECRCETYKSWAIQVLERHGPSVATVTWSDATACHYAEQLWRRCIARKSGRCAVSGQLIAKGDAVYRPRSTRYAPPKNVDAMILASVMEAISSDEDVS